MHGYTTIVGRLCAEQFPPDTPLRRITEEQARRYQDRFLLDGKLGRESIRRRLVVLRRILQHAKKLGWIGENPLTELQVVSQPPPDPDFNVLEPSQVEAVARAIAAVPDEELPLMRNGLFDQRAFAATSERRALWADVVRVAAYTGLRFGELRALRSRDVNFSGESILVRRNAPTSAPGGTAPKAPKSGKGRSVPLIPQAIAALDRDELLFRVEPRRATLAKTPDFLARAGTVPVPAAKRGTPWDEVLRRTRRERAERRR